MIMISSLLLHEHSPWHESCRVMALINNIPTVPRFSRQFHGGLTMIEFIPRQKISSEKIFDCNNIKICTSLIAKVAAPTIQPWCLHHSTLSVMMIMIHQKIRPPPYLDHLRRCRLHRLPHTTQIIIIYHRRHRHLQPRHHLPSISPARTKRYLPLHLFGKMNIVIHVQYRREEEQ